MEKIKLVIWDLDETFWKGTLSEEGIEPINEHVKIVKQLCNRGIMNSIVSKNDFEPAKNKLIELGVWNYFIFPKIEWNSKGHLIKQLIKECQLRDNNVLFIDDNNLNLKEAKFYNPNINIQSPNFIPNILTHSSLIGKDDKQHSRLKHYKILEEKHQKSLEYSDNKDFLRASEIKIQIIKGKQILEHIDRVAELIERTNQLNFTKKRIDKNETIQLINNNEFDL